MSKVVGFNKAVFNQFTCWGWGAIVEYAPNEAVGQYMPCGGRSTDEGTYIHGLYCPNCGKFHKTNP